jgi:hypothetical protein
LGRFFVIAPPLVPDDEGAEVVGGEQQREAKADYGKPDKNPRVQIGPGYPTDNTQGKEQDVYRADTVHHDKNEQYLGYPGSPLPGKKKFHSKLLQS